jgi:hypothetical protein
MLSRKLTFQILGLLLFLSMIVPTLSASVANAPVSEPAVEDVEAPVITQTQAPIVNEVAGKPRQEINDYAADTNEMRSIYAHTLAKTAKDEIVKETTLPKAATPVNPRQVVEDDWTEGTLMQNEFVYYSIDVNSSMAGNILVVEVLYYNSSEQMTTDDYLTLMLDDSSMTIDAAQGEDGSVVLANVVDEDTYQAVLFGSMVEETANLVYNITYYFVMVPPALPTTIAMSNNTEHNYTLTTEAPYNPTFGQMAQMFEGQEWVELTLPDNDSAEVNWEVEITLDFNASEGDLDLYLGSDLGMTNGTDSQIIDTSTGSSTEKITTVLGNGTYIIAIRTFSLEVEELNATLNVAAEMASGPPPVPAVTYNMANMTINSTTSFALSNAYDTYNDGYPTSPESVQANDLFALNSTYWVGFEINEGYGE